MNARCETVAPEHATDAMPMLEALAPSMQAIAGLLRACVGADACLIAIKRSGARRGQLCSYEISSRRGLAASPAAKALFDLPEQQVLVDIPSLEDSAMRRMAEIIATAAQLNQVSSVMCLPLHLMSMKARVCVVSQHGCFTPVDLGNLALLAEQVGALIECIHFGEQLAMDATGHQRRQISRDLHDSAIQPLIGLKLGLEALRRRLAEEDYLVKDLDDLIAVAAGGIGEMREYVGALRAHSRSRAVHT